MLEIVVAGERAADVSAVVPIRFARASRGAPNIRTPDIDNQGYKESGKPDDFMPARGPTLSMTMGGAEIRIRVVRDALGREHDLFVTTRKKGGEGDKSALTVVWPPHSGSLNAPGPGFKKDHIYLRSDLPLRGGHEHKHLIAKRHAEDEAIALSEAENERLLVNALKQYELDPQLALDGLSFNLESEWKTKFPRRRDDLNLSVETPSLDMDAFLHDPKRDADRRESRDLERWLDDAVARFDIKKEELEDVWDGFHFPRRRREKDKRDRPEPAEIGEIIASAKPLPARVEVMRALVERRRAAASKSPTSFVLEVRLAAADGPLLAELGVVVFPPLVVEVQPFFVSLGAGKALGGNAPDRTHLDYLEGKGPLDYPALVTLLSRVNGVLAPAGVHLFSRASEPRAFRVADEVDRPAAPPERLGEQHGPDVYVKGFDALFEQGALYTADNDKDGRTNPWLNIIMESQAGPRTEKRLSVYFFRAFIKDPSQKDVVNDANSKITAQGVGSEYQTQGAAKLSIRGRPSVKKGKPRKRNVAKVTHEYSLGPDRVGMAVNLAALGRLAPLLRGQSILDGAPAPWLVLRTLARTIAHEFAHVCNISHYRGKSGADSLHHLWAVKNVMHTQALLDDDHPDAGYGAIKAGLSGRVSGAQLTVKNHPDPPGDYTGVYNRGVQQVRQIREAVLHNRYFGPGGTT